MRWLRPFRSKRLWRLGIVLSPIIAIAAAAAAYINVDWPTSPDSIITCYVTDPSAYRGVRAGFGLADCRAADNKREKSGSLLMGQEYRGVMLYNGEGYDAARFSEVASYFKELRDSVLATHYRQLALTWCLVAFAAIGAVAALWGTMLAADWVLTD